MTCANASSTVTIPTSGTATIVPVDTTTCAPLDATQVTGSKMVNGVVTQLSGASQPAMTTDGSGIHLSAAGLALGASIALTFVYTPNGKSWPMTATIGQAVTPSGTTLTP